MAKTNCPLRAKTTYTHIYNRKPEILTAIQYIISLSPCDFMIPLIFDSLSRTDECMKTGKVKPMATGIRPALTR